MEKTDKLISNLTAYSSESGPVWTTHSGGKWATCRSEAEAAGLRNVKIVLRDFVGEGTGLPEQSVDYVMLFNTLHAEEPDILLMEASRILRPGGALGGNSLEL